MNSQNQPKGLDISEIKIFEDKIKANEKKIEEQKEYMNKLSAAYNRIKTQVQEKQELIEKYKEEIKQNYDPESALEKIKLKYKNVIGIEKEVYLYRFFKKNDQMSCSRSPNGRPKHNTLWKNC